MATLCDGVRYDLSSKDCVSENKEIIFVKLTESALHAIEEHLKSETNQNPTIQFVGNEGRISFPSDSNKGSTSFNFSLSSSDDMTGRGGSFECVKGPLRNNLDVLGPISTKMRIHANDDTFKATCDRMAVVRDNHNNKCIREIKPNQTDIGRMVKVKQTGNRCVSVPKRALPPARHCSNVIHDKWQMLERSQSQKLTPPSRSSSDGDSSGIGQSPKSKHSESPSSAIGLPSNVPSGNKQPGYFDGADSLPTKKRRISHYSKPIIIENRLTRDSHNLCAGLNCEKTFKPIIIENRLIREGRNLSSGLDREKTFKTNIIENRPINEGRNLSAGLNREKTFKPFIIENRLIREGHHLSAGLNREKIFVHKNDNNDVSFPNKTTPSNGERNNSIDVYEKSTNRNDGSKNAFEIWHEKEREGEKNREREQAQTRWRKDEYYTARNDAFKSIVKEYSKVQIESYLTEYTTIRDVQQRRSYKSYFDSRFDEYMHLHTKIEQVSKRFLELGERLRQEEPSSPGYKKIEHQIVREYTETKADARYQMVKRRYDYLNAKLSHIKQLVAKYDETIQQNTGEGVGG